MDDGPESSDDENFMPSVPSLPSNKNKQVNDPRKSIPGKKKLASGKNWPQSIKRKVKSTKQSRHAVQKDATPPHTQSSDQDSSPEKIIISEHQLSHPMESLSDVSHPLEYLSVHDVYFDQSLDSPTATASQEQPSSPWASFKPALGQFLVSAVAPGSSSACSKSRLHKQKKLKVP